MGMVVKRLDVFLGNLDPTVGSEMQKTRPCFVISPVILLRLASLQ